MNYILAIINFIAHIIVGYAMMENILWLNFAGSMIYGFTIAFLAINNK